jgi:hypothetical protein
MGWSPSRQFKIKTALNDAKDSVKQTASSVGSDAKDAASNVSADGLLNASAWQLVVGLLAATVLFAVVNAATRGDSVDRYTSDGTQLQFGQRQQRDDPYRPVYGSQ